MVLRVWYNINFFKKELKILFAIARRYKYVFSLAFLDVNGLKEINDKYGHVTGDAVLKKAALIAKEVFRQSDIVIRYGGDEFVVLFPGVDKSLARLAVERLKKELANKGFVYIGRGDKVPVSVSAGVAEYEEKLQSENDLLELADAEMYEDKKNRR
jgi:two-component system, cell cycle response regulator